MQQKFGNGHVRKNAPIFPHSPKWYCECYHLEDVPHKRTNSRGDTEVYYTREKVVTHTDSATMSYHFSRDVSGPFVLECDPNAIRNKYFIKLQLFQNIDFADSLKSLSISGKKQLLLI